MAPARNPPRPAASAPDKGEGQWALGYREPLNPNERSKKDDDGLNVRAADREHLLQARLRLDRPGRPARPVPLVGPLHPAQARASTAARPRCSSREELDDEYFMLRVRIDGGAAHAPTQLRVIARDLRASSRRDTADITDRQNIQLHWIRIEDVPEIWRARSRPSACPPPRPAATPRGSSSAARRRHRRRRDHRRHAGDRGDRRALHRRPGVLQPAAQVQDRDHRLARSQDVAPRDQRRRRSSASCTPSTAPASTSGSAAACPPTRCSPSGSAPGSRSDEVADVWAGVVGDLPRLRLPAAAHPGPAEVPGRRLGRRRSSARCWRRSTSSARCSTARRPPLPDGAARPRRRAPAEGRPLLRRRSPRRSAGSSGTTLAAARRPRRGSTARDRVRTTPQQKLRRPRRRRPTGSTRWSPALDGARACRRRPSTFRRDTMACTGIEFCKLAIVETKARGGRAGRRARAAAARLRRAAHRSTSTAARTPAPASRSPTSASRASSSLDADGDQVEGFQVHLGGGLGLDAGFGRKLRGHKVTADELPDYVERVVRRLRRRAARPASGSPTGSARADEEALR